MSSAVPKTPPERTPVDRKIDSVLAEFGGDARAAIGALLHNREELLRDADRAASLGFLWGRFSEGARPFRDPE